ncbi:MAG: hypothetical protein K0U13_03095, partial [Chlamydiae bacterium]|nr:hypothetical protein [Chlamydiota bacterium]
FMVQIMAPLFEDGPIERMAKLLDGPILQAQTPTAATINEIRRVLVERLGFEPHYTPFLLDRKIAAPDTFASLSREEQEKLSITRHFMTELIFQLFEMRTVLDHQRSVYLNEPHQTPARHKTQISAQFHDPLLTAALTVKAAYQQGLSEDDVKKFLIQLIERDLHEREALSLETTSWQSIFDSWGIGGQQLRHINPHDIITVEDVALKIDRNPKAIALYLELVGLREIGYCPEQTSCSPADFVAGCDQGLYFSATPGPQFTYPLQIDKWREASEFEEQVVLEASHRRNSTIRSINSLDAILSSQQNNVVIDPEGYLNIENRKFASRWIQMAPNLQAVIFFNKGQLTLMKNTHHCFPLLGSDSIEKQLRKFGLSLTNKGVGVYFDVEHCEAANIPLPPDSAAAVLIPEKSTRSRVIQGVMRMRGFLKVDSKQRVTWLTDESYGGMSVAEIFEQLKINESQGISLKRAKMAAFSEVARIVAERYEQEKREKLGPLLRTAPNLMQYCLEHINGIIELKPQDYVQSYASREHEIPIEESLMHFAQKLHRAYYDKEMEISEIEAVIARVQPVVPTISSSAEQEGAIHMQQNMEEMMEVHQAELKPRAENPLEAKHSYGELKLVLPEFFEEVMNFEKASSYYEWTGFLPAVHLDRNHTETASLANEPGVRLIKSIESFLIIEKEGQLIAYVTSDDLSKSYAHQMRRFKSEASSHRAILISALSGTVMERGREGSGIRMSDEQIQALLEGEWLKKLRVHAALARGEFLKPSADLSLDDIEREIRELQEPESCFAGVLKRQIDRTFAEEIKKRQLMQRMSDIVTATIIK